MPSPARAPQISKSLGAIADQPLVRNLLASALAEGKLSHAYLFVGAPGAGKTEAALALAECVVCPNGGDGTCGECLRVKHGTHPDVRVLSPGSASGYLVAQVRDLIAEVALAPVRAKTKVYILTEAALLRGTAANALLKTIEEPPEGVMFILVARSAAAVLPTIASRCQEVAFKVVSADAAERSVEQKNGLRGDEVRIALAVAQTPERAVEFLNSSDRREVRRLMVRAIVQLARADSWDVLISARDIAREVQISVGLARRDDKKRRREDVVKEEVQRRTEGSEDYWTPTALKQLEDTVKRELTGRERLGMMEALAAAESLLRDVLVRSEGVDEAIVNTDVADSVDRIAAATCTAGVLKALAAIKEARRDLMRNVTPQLAMEAMLLSVKEALTCPPSYR